MNDAMTHYFEKCVILGRECVIASQIGVTLSSRNDALLTLSASMRHAHFLNDRSSLAEAMTQ